jgi:hypothetical protein
MAELMCWGSMRQGLKSQHPVRQYAGALLAGCAGLAINIALLNTADHFGVVTARGGFQKLAKLWFSMPLVTTGVASLWSGIGLPAPETGLFMVSFKVGVGLCMSAIYPVIEPRLPGNWVTKGLAYAAAVWLANAAIVLPLLGEGFAGYRSLTPGGMAWFAFAHTAFFLILAYIFPMTRDGDWRVEAISA